MTHIGTAIGAIVGVFIALIVGLNLTGNVFDETAGLNGSREAYSTTQTGETLVPVGGSAIPSTPGTVSATVVAGAVTVVTVGGGGGYTVDGNYRVVKGTGADETGGGAIVKCLLLATCATTSIVDGSGDGVANAVLDKFIAVRPIIGILPTVVVIGLFIAGAAVGGTIGRVAQNKFA